MFKSLAAKLSLPMALPVVAATVAIALASSPAYAGLEIQLQSDGQTYTQTGANGSPLTVIQSIGNFSTTVNTGNATTAPALDLSSVDISSSAGGTLVVTLSANGFTSPQGAATWLSQFTGNFPTGSATVTLQTYLDTTDTLLGTGTLLSTLTASSTPFSLSDLEAASTDGPFALTEVLTITTNGSAFMSLDGSVADAVPEPASLTMLGSSLIGLFYTTRRKRNNAA
jgi:hypothetical protein